MLPIPKHLKSVIKTVGQENSEFMVTGQIQCDCGNDTFKIKIVADDSAYETDNVIKVVEIEGHFFLIVKLQCNGCGKEHLIFDHDLHGWNGFMEADEAEEIQKPPAKTWSCNKCRAENHKMIVTIQSQGQDDFVNEAGEDFDKNDWIEAFEWIIIGTECNNCGEINEEWVSYETM